MCNNATCLGYLLLVILLGFSILIYFLLRNRKKFLAENLQLIPDQVYKTVSQRAGLLGFSKSHLIYGIYQDKTMTIKQVVVKDFNGDEIGSIENYLGVRKTDIIIGNERHQIEYPLTWRKSALLKNAKGELLATYERLPFSLRKHKFIIPNIGTIISQSPPFDFRYPFNYELNGKVIGITQQVATRVVGSIVLFPVAYPLNIKIFILAINATGI